MSRIKICPECKGEGTIEVDTSHSCTKMPWSECCGGCGYEAECDTCGGTGDCPHDDEDCDCEVELICDKCGKEVRSEEEYKLFCGCSGCASTLD